MAAQSELSAFLAPEPGPDALVLEAIDDLAELGRGDQIVVEFYPSSGLNRSLDTVSGRVTEVVASDLEDRISRVEFVDGAGEAYSVDFGGSVTRRLPDRDHDAQIGYSADIEVVREIAPDGGVVR